MFITFLQQNKNVNVNEGGRGTLEGILPESGDGWIFFGLHGRSSVVRDVDGNSVQVEQTKEH